MKYKGELCVVISALGFSLMPVFAKIAYNGGASVTTVLQFRFIFAAIFIWSYIFIKKIDYKLKLKQILMLLVLGAVFYSASAITLFNAYKLISAGVAQVLIFTYPAWVLLISTLFFKEKVNINKVYAIVLSIIGTTIVAYTPGQKFSALGIILALIGAVAYALYVSFIDHGEFDKVHPIVMTGYILLFANLSFLIYGLSKGELSVSFSRGAWISIAMLAFFSTSIAILAFCTGAKLIGSGKAAIVSTLEPISTFVFSYIFLGEKVSYNMVFGGAVVIMAILSINIFKTQRNNE
jgi:drug/metabolite transporter (DMT)-like permease